MTQYETAIIKLLKIFLIVLKVCFSTKIPKLVISYKQTMNCIP